MPFAKVDTQVNFPALEREVLAFWERTGAFEALRAKNRGGPRWSFLDGPITANNPMGVHHAWGRTYKDAFQRYHAMNGHDQRYQNGFDCQGLWVEVEVEKELNRERAGGLKSKRDIEELVPGDVFASIDHFVQLCKKRVDYFAKVQTEQSIRLGYWMDWDREEDWKKSPDERRSYFTMSDENNYTIWSFLKKCHSRHLVYRGYDAMPWCPRCAVGLSQMEMAEGYQLVAHRAVFVRFPLRDRPGENLLAWTTTPWTLSSNVAAAVNPELTYLKVRTGEQTYYVAKGAFTAKRLEEEFKRKEWIEGVPKLKTLEQRFKERKGAFEITGEVKGADMVGWAYDGPFDDLPAQGNAGGYPQAIAEVALKQRWTPAIAARDVHRVIAWKDVGEAEGTGIVHIAPGCGKEDFLLGKEQGLPPVAPLDECGIFVAGYGPLTGRAAVDHQTTDWILQNLQERGLAFAVEEYPHAYPHCWRCKTELLFRLVDEWFIDMKWRDEIMKVCHDIHWIPEDGLKRELNWLENMGDWMISKKRFWGLALPIWVDEVTGDYEVIGSQAELKERAVEGWDRFEGHSPHRPWVDLVKIRNPKTGNVMSRIPDVGNPWLDAGIVPFSTMGYNRDRDYWQKWFPADFITESFPGQFRNWFYALLAMSTMMENRAPFKVLLGHALVRDQYGKPMHKSDGNAIEFNGAADSGYEIDHELSGNEKPTKPELALSFQVIEKEKEGKTVRAIRAKYPPMSADVIRWLYCRHNPTQNVNFGPTPANDVRGRFVMKLWNVYSFLSNYARLDEFDPTATPVPVAKRPDIDRWILSDLQELIVLARESFESYELMKFCLEAERFVDDKVSNWYVRRNRRRFWKSEHGSDKQAAYQTLYTVMMTLTKLLAPALPFLSETMYQNLRTPDDPDSVHLTEYPKPDPPLIDEQLTNEMDALLHLVSVGGSARDGAKMKRRQPLSEMVVRPATDGERRAVERFADQIREELNVKEVKLHDPALGSLLKLDVKPNPKTLGPKFGSRLKQVQAAIAATPVAELSAKVSAGQPFDLVGEGGPFTLEPADFFVATKAPEGWAGVAERGTEVMLCVTLTTELRQEGLARDVVRQIQDQRKEAGLEPEDHIELFLMTESDVLREAINACGKYIAGETLADQWATAPLNGDAHCAEVKLEGHNLTIQLKKVSAPS
jgi:isoleucyl-tRNA synthetase